jgi:hypothetical protein
VLERATPTRTRTRVYGSLVLWDISEARSIIPRKAVTTNSNEGIADDHRSVVRVREDSKSVGDHISKHVKTQIVSGEESRATFAPALSIDQHKYYVLRHARRGKHE